MDNLGVHGYNCFMQKGRARNDYDEETAYGSYINPKPGFQSGPGGSVTPIRWHSACKLLNPVPLGGAQKNPAC